MNKVFVLVLSDRTGNEVLNVYTTEQKQSMQLKNLKNYFQVELSNLVFLT